MIVQMDGGHGSAETDERIERFTVIDFLAFCGGSLGVSMGISVLSIIEIVYFVTLRLFWVIRRSKSNNSVVPLEHECMDNRATLPTSSWM